MATRGIPGLAVAMATAGGILVYVGVRDVPLVDGLRDMLKGKTPAGRDKKPVELPPEFVPTFGDADASGAALLGGGGGGGLGSQIVAAARKYIGVPYVWGGHSPAGFDCSGLVTYVLAKDLGRTNLPNNIHVHTLQWIAWRGATSIPRAQCAPGDLACWPGHMGIATSTDKMIHAPTFGQSVKEGGIMPGAIIRRVNP